MSATLILGIGYGLVTFLRLCLSYSCLRLSSTFLIKMRKATDNQLTFLILLSNTSYM